MTFDTSRTLPSSRTGYPFITPVIRGTRSMPAGAKSFRRTRPKGIPRGGSRKWSRSFLPSARLYRQPRRHEPHDGCEKVIGKTPGAGRVPGRCPGPITMSGDGGRAPLRSPPQSSRRPPRALLLLEFERGSGIPSSGAGRCTRRARARMPGPWGCDTRRSPRPRSRQTACARPAHLESIPDFGQSVDFDPGPDRELELAGISLQIVGGLVLGGIRGGRSRKQHPRQSVVTAGRKQP